MKNTVEKYQNYNPLLTRIEKEYLIAAQDKPVSALMERECIDKLLQIINISFAELGLSPAGSTLSEKSNFLEAITMLVRKDILGYFPDITIPEISNAISRGIRNEYGKYYGFNVISIHFFIENYLKSEDRVSALKKQKRLESSRESSNVISEEEKWNIYKKGLSSCYENYCKQRIIIDCGNVNYDFLVFSGLINLSADEKNLIYEIAKQQILKEQEMQAISYVIANQFRKQNEIDDTPIRSRAKEIALRNYFATNPDFSSMDEVLYQGFKKAMAFEKARLKNRQ